MKKIGLGILIAVVISVLTVGVASALPSKPVAPPGFVSPFPSQPPENQLQKVIFIRYAPGKAPAKPCDYDGVCDANEKGWCADCKNGGEEPPPGEPTTACYGFLSGSQPRWNWVEDYYSDDSGLKNTSGWATNVWDIETSATIFGEGLSGAGPWGKYDYQNSIVYGNYGNPDVIAVTAIWYRGKNIYEYDILFDKDYFPGKVDLNTVTLHEFGHAAGLGDLYDSVCMDEVMYGYYQGIKTSLGDGDRVGIQTLYGL